MGRRLHDGFVSGYRRDAVSRTGFFCQRDWEWGRKIQARFVTFRRMAGVGVLGMLDTLEKTDSSLGTPRESSAASIPRVWATTWASSCRQMPIALSAPCKPFCRNRASQIPRAPGGNRCPVSG